MSTAAAQLDATKAIELLRHQRTLYRKLRALADRQKTLVVREDGEALISLLADRQRLVDGLVQLSRQMGPFREKWTEFFNGLSDAQREEVACLLEEVNASLGAILKSDARDTATMTARRARVATELGDIGGGRVATAAYARCGASGAARTDAKA